MEYLISLLSYILFGLSLRASEELRRHILQLYPLVFFLFLNILLHIAWDHGKKEWVCILSARHQMRLCARSMCLRKHNVSRALFCQRLLDNVDKSRIFPVTEHSIDLCNSKHSHHMIIKELPYFFYLYFYYIVI